MTSPYILEKLNEYGLDLLQDAEYDCRDVGTQHVMLAQDDESRPQLVIADHNYLLTVIDQEDFVSASIESDTAVVDEHVYNMGAGIAGGLASVLTGGAIPAWIATAQGFEHVHEESTSVWVEFKYTIGGDGTFFRQKVYLTAGTPVDSFVKSRIDDFLDRVNTIVGAFSEYVPADDEEDWGGEDAEDSGAAESAPEKDSGGSSREVVHCQHALTFVPSCPVQIVETCVYRNRATGHSEFTVEVKNVSQQAVKSVYFDAVILDDANDEVEKLCGQVLQGIDLYPRGSSGWNHFISAGGSAAYRVDVRITKVTLQNDEVWRRSASDNEIPFTEPVQLGLSPVERELLRRELGVVGIYQYEQGDGYWMCSCGQVNVSPAAQCCMCGSSTEQLRDIDDVDKVALVVSTARNRDIDAAVANRLKYLDRAAGLAATHAEVRRLKDEERAAAERQQAEAKAAKKKAEAAKKKAEADLRESTRLKLCEERESLEAELAQLGGAIFGAKAARKRELRTRIDRIALEIRGLE